MDWILIGLVAGWFLIRYWIRWRRRNASIEITFSGPEEEPLGRHEVSGRHERREL